MILSLSIPLRSSLPGSLRHHSINLDTSFGENRTSNKSQSTGKQLVLTKRNRLKNMRLRSPPATHSHSMIAALNMNKQIVKSKRTAKGKQLFCTSHRNRLPVARIRKCLNKTIMSFWVVPVIWKKNRNDFAPYEPLANVYFMQLYVNGIAIGTEIGVP